LKLARTKGALDALHSEEVRLEEQIENMVLKSSKVLEIHDCLDSAEKKILAWEEENKLAESAAKQELEFEFQRLELLRQRVADIDFPKRPTFECGALPVNSKKYRFKARGALRATKAAIRDLRRQIAIAEGKVADFRQEAVTFEYGQDHMRDLRRHMKLQTEFAVQRLELKKSQKVEQLKTRISCLESRLGRRQSVLVNKRQQIEAKREMLVHFACDCGPGRERRMIESEIATWNAEIRPCNHHLLSSWLERVERDCIFSGGAHR
jgi:chromosome segregation ATPase